ncbi:hypothetical protein [Kurthia huakuii]|uniref:hypothetical protein n=1 Tax=Kurthia huakuii TaxID=1421019 RepID=UPI0004967EC7|nr:hypothetical protein [Kurthia huakuii]MBM7699189.1 hypothetical protein [Kurthia huakuii]
MANNKQLNVKAKNRRKVVRTILEVIAIMAAAFFVVKSVFFLYHYDEPKATANNSKQGFVAISYFGVDRSGSTKHIGREQLAKQLTLLKEQGFTTISQQQIIDFYEKGTPLPEKALFLSFEDGRTDSSIFSQSTLEKLNFKATMFTYADNTQSKDNKFLTTGDIQSMVDSGYWEHGTNGNHLSYINAYTPNGDYLGEVPENAVTDKTKIEYYNHFLMDYLRDEHMIPKETVEKMDMRLTNEYTNMKKMYTKDGGTLPKAYAIMHANAMYNTMDDMVEKVNERNIHNLFSLHFNTNYRAYNDAKQDVYNLNRMQVAPYWATNHMLMKMKDESAIPIEFTVGDKKLAADWLVEQGRGEFTKQDIILTSEVDKEVSATLTKKWPAQAIVSADFNGAVMGTQSMTLSDGTVSAKVSLQKNKLLIQTQNGSKKGQLQKMNLQELDWKNEDYAFGKASNYTYLQTQEGSRVDKTAYPSNVMNNRDVRIQAVGERLIITVDGKEYKAHLPKELHDFALTLSGEALASDTEKEQFVDTIYDAFFGDVTVTKNREVLYSTRASAPERALDAAKKQYDNVVDFFIHTF